MNESEIKSILSNLTFRRLIWLTPLTYLIHILEEAPTFYIWVKAYFKSDYTFMQFVIANSIIMAVYVVLIILYNIRPNRVTALIVLFGILAAQFHNAIFHFFCTIYFLAYSPGVISGLILYIPLSCFITFKAYQENFINKISGVIIFIISGVAMWVFVYFTLMY